MSVPLSGNGGPAVLSNGSGDDEGSVGSAPYLAELLDEEEAGVAAVLPRASGVAALRPHETVDRVASLRLNETVEYFEDTSSPHGALPFDPNRTGNLSIASRHRLHARLKSYEAQRRIAYRNKWESTDLYWRSARDLQVASLQEVAVARGTVLCRVSAEEVVGRAAASIAAGDVHWDTGRYAPPNSSPVKGARSPVGKQTVHTSAPTSPQTLSNEEAAERALADLDPTPAPPAPHVSLVECVRRSHAGLAERHQEFTAGVRAHVLPVLERLREQLAARAARDGRLGDALLAELRTAEVRVAEAWEEYFGAAFASLREVHSASCDDARGPHPHPARHRAGHARSSPNAADRPYVPPRRDVWVADMQYRMAVAFLSACWEKCQETLAQIFLRMKVDECKRRAALQEAMSTFLRLQRNLWEELPRAFATGVPDKTLCPVDREAVEQEVDGAIRQRARAIRAAGGDAEEYGNVGSPKPPVTTAPSPDEFSPEDRSIELDSPLTSKLLGKARVVERRGNKLGVWRASLAFVTTDSYLHVFDVAYFTGIKKGSATEVAFHSLVPQLDIPTEKSVQKDFHTWKTRPPKVPRRAWHDLLTPTHSVYLPNCEVAYKPKLGVAAFEVVETVPNAHVAAIFSPTTTRKLHFRTVSQEETVDWIVALKAQR